MRTRTLLAGGAGAGPLFVAVFLVKGATPDDFDPLRHPISSLPLGPSAWRQTARFLVAGLLTLALALGRLDLGTTLDRSLGRWSAGSGDRTESD